MSRINGQVSGPKQADFTYKTVVLKGNASFKDQIETAEGPTKFVIRWDFDLNDEFVTVPENCILEFDGGSLKNGTIIGQDTVYINVGDVDIWGENLTREGTWREHSGGGGGNYHNEDAHLSTLEEITPESLQAFFDQALDEKRNIDLDGMTITVTRMINLNNKVLHKNYWWWTIKNGDIICDVSQTHALFTADNDAPVPGGYPHYGHIIFENIRFINSDVEPNLPTNEEDDEPWGHRNIYSPWVHRYDFAAPDPVGQYQPLTRRCIVLSGNRLIKVHFHFCHFDGIGAGHTGGYLQSLMFDGCRIQNLEYPFVQANKAYDIRFINSIAEWGMETSVFDIELPEHCIISDSAIQYVRWAFKFKGGQSVSITNSYFEGCRDHVVEQYGGWDAQGFAFTGNVCIQGWFDNVSDGGVGEYHYLHFGGVLKDYLIQGNSYWRQSYADADPKKTYPRPEYTVNDLEFAKGGSTGILIKNELDKGLKCWKDKDWYDADGFNYETKKYGSSDERPFDTVMITDFPIVYKYIDWDEGHNDDWKAYNPDPTSDDNKYCTLIDVSEYRNKKIIINNTSHVWGTFLTDEDQQEIGQVAAFCNGYYGRGVSFDNGIGVLVPEDAKYLYILLHNKLINYIVYSAAIMQETLPERFKAGAQYFDLELNKPIWLNASDPASEPYWVNAEGFDINTKKYGNSSERPFDGTIINPVEGVQKYIDIDTGVWTDGDATHDGALVDVTSKEGYFIKINSSYCWVAFLADTPVVGQRVEFVGSYIQYSSPMVLHVPEGAKYLYILLKHGDEIYYVYSIDIISDVLPSDYEVGYRFFDFGLNKPLWFGGYGNPAGDNWVCADGFGANVKRFGTTIERPFGVTKITAVTPLDYIMDGDTKAWVAGGGSYQSALVDVSAYRNRYLQIDCTRCYYSFFRAEPSIGHTVAFADGYTGVVASDKPQRILVPENAVYLYIVLKIPTATYTIESVNIINGYLPVDKQAGFQYFDTTINKPIWFSGNSFVGDDGWVDAEGNDPYAANEPNG